MEVPWSWCDVGAMMQKLRRCCRLGAVRVSLCRYCAGAVALAPHLDSAYFSGVGIVSNTIWGSWFEFLNVYYYTRQPCIPQLERRPRK